MNSTVRTEGNARLHHVGCVVASLQDCAAGFAAALGTDWDGNVVHDPVQKVNVTFVSPFGAGATMIELIEPVGEDSPVNGILKRQGGGLYHLCIEVADLDGSLATARERGALVLQEPVEAAAFDRRRIAWIVTRDKLIVEYLER